MDLGLQQDIAATAVAASFDRPIAVSVMSKLDKYPFLQLLGYNAQLGYMKQGFLGLQDFSDEMALYSNTNQILKAAWNLIKYRVPLNLDMQAQLYKDPVLGEVGLPFLALVGFAQTFAVDTDQLLNSTADAVVSQS
jgi:hypothetical protein